VAERTQTRVGWEERFWSKVDVRGPDECWNWTGGHNERGSGIFKDPDSNKMAVATRVLWRKTKGPIPDGIQVLHRCDNPPCVNPAHLFLGTRSDNMQDMFAKGRDDVGRRRGAPLTKLTPEKMAEVRLLAAAGAPIRAIAREYGVWPSTIRKRLAQTQLVEV
jgi:hypothetical protein